MPLPKQVGKEHRYLTHEQVRRLVDASGPHAAMVQLLAYTGLRWGEAAALQVRDVSLLRRRLFVARNATLVNGTVTVGTPKNYQRGRVPFPQLLVPALEPAVAGEGP